MMDKINTQYYKALKLIKSAILQNQLEAAKAVNRQMLALYYGVGKYVSDNTRKGVWGTGAIETISEQLRRELPGLRGFGVSNIKNLRQFYESWNVAVKRVCQNTQYKNIKLVVCPFMDAQRVFHFSVNLTFKSLVGNKYCVYRHK